MHHLWLLITVCPFSVFSYHRDSFARPFRFLYLCSSLSHAKHTENYTFTLFYNYLSFKTDLPSVSRVQRDFVTSYNKSDVSFESPCPSLPLFSSSFPSFCACSFSLLLNPLSFCFFHYLPLSLYFVCHARVIYLGGLSVAVR